MRRIKVRYLQQMDVETTMVVGDVTLDAIIEKLNEGEGSKSFMNYLNVERQENILSREDILLGDKLLCVIIDADSNEFLYSSTELKIEPEHDDIRTT